MAGPPLRGSASLPHDMKHLRQAFDTCDTNRDGFLTLEELCEWMQKLGLLLTREGLTQLLQTHDRNLDGRLDFNEFVDMSSMLDLPGKSDSHARSEASSSRLAPRGTGQEHSSTAKDENYGDEDSDLRDAFRVFDKNGNGLISPAELHSTLSQLGMLAASTNISRIHSMIRRVDSDGDGEVSFAEFKFMMTAAN